MLRYVVLTIVCWLPLGDIAQAAPPVVVQVDVPPTCRVRNRTGSQCVWASIETLARKHNIGRASDLTNFYGGVASEGDVNSVLQSRGFQLEKHYYQSYRGMTWNTTFIPRACQHGWGACAGIGHGNICHLVNVVHYKDGVVKIIDNFGPRALEVQEWPESKFLSLWNGWAISLVPPTTTTASSK